MAEVGLARVHPWPGADPENCFGRGTLDLSRRRRRSETTKRDDEGGEEEMSSREVYTLPSRLGERRISSSSGVWGGAPATNDFGHYRRNFVRFYACFNAFWNITGKVNKTDPIRPPLPAIGLEGARALVSPVWIRPCPWRFSYLVLLYNL